MLNTLRSGLAVRDSDFDSIYPQAIRDVSETFWTPVAIAREAALWLSEGGAKRVLDIGAGVGKFCLVGAAVVPDTTFVGIEHRPHLVEVARETARNCGLTNVSMVCGTLESFPWHSFGAFYLFNPFDENNFMSTARLDNTVELSTRRFIRDVRVTESCLRIAPLETRVVTYHGFGGIMPVEYALEYKVPYGMDYLCYWRKRYPRMKRKAEWSGHHRLC